LVTTTEEAAEAPDYHINKQPTTYQKSGQIRKSTDFKTAPPIDHQLKLNK